MDFSQFNDQFSQHMKTSIAYTFALLLCAAGTIQAQEQDTTTQAAPVAYGWTYRAFTMDEIRLHPARDLDQILLLSPGVTVSAAPIAWSGLYASGRGSLPAEYTLHIRGSRKGTADYQLNGISVLDRFSNTSGLVFIPEAIEEVVIHSGAYGVQYGSAGGGVVDLRLRRGGDQWTVSAQHVTDDLASTGSSFLNTFSYGQHTTTVTAGGPLMLDARLFVAAEVHRMRDRTPRWVEPFSFDLVTAPYDNPANTPLPEPFEMKANHVPLSSLERSAFTWNLTVPALGVDVEWWGMVTSSQTRDAEMYAMVRSYYRQRRTPWWDENRAMIGLTVSDEVMSGVSVQATILRDQSWAHTTDPDFGEDWRLYSDSLANADKGYTGFMDRYYNYTGYSTAEYLTFEKINSPNRVYSKRSSGLWRAQVSVDWNVAPTWSVSFLAESEWWTLRKLEVSGTGDYRSLLDTNGDGVDDRTFANAIERENFIRRYGTIEGYGYDWKGDPLDDTHFGSRRPAITSLAASGVWHDGPVRVEAGVRNVWISTDVPTLKRANTADGLYDDLPFDYLNYLVDPSVFGPAARTVHFLPRFSLLHAEQDLEAYVSWGKYVDMLSWKELHTGFDELSNQLTPYRNAPYSVNSPVMTSAVRPEITSQTEAGIRWTANEAVRVEASVFIKSMPGQAQLGTVTVDRLERQPTAIVNNGESKALGFEANATFSSGREAVLRLGYGYLEARGYTAHSWDNFLDVVEPTLQTVPTLFPLEYEVNHRFTGSLMLTAPEDSWWSGLSGMISGRLDAGHPFTKLSVSGVGGSLTPWFSNMRMYYYPWSQLIEEPKNASRTPWTLTLDLTASYQMDVGPVNVRAFVAVTNVLNTKTVVNFFPTTRSSTDDGWLTHESAVNWLQNYPKMESLYRALNLQNRYGYRSMSGRDIYGSPRQLRIGMEVGI